MRTVELVMLLSNSCISEKYIQAKHSQLHAEVWRGKQINLISEYRFWHYLLWSYHLCFFAAAGFLPYFGLLSCTTCFIFWEFSLSLRITIYFNNFVDPQLRGWFFLWSKYKLSVLYKSNYDLNIFLPGSKSYLKAKESWVLWDKF